jgi:diacylglycerol kinase family enzyme
MRAALVVNPAASRVTPELTAAVEAELTAAGPVETVLTRGKLDAQRLVADLGREVERVYVYSGDGGFNEAVNGADGSVPLAFLPGGATSVLPRALGLPRDPVAAARLLGGSETTRRISLGRAGDRRFAFAAGLGLDAELVREVERLGRAEGRRAGDLTWARLLASLLVRRRGRLEPSLTVLGRRRVAFALVANTTPYTYAWKVPLPVAPAARFELGLDLVAPERVTPTRLPLLLPQVLLGRAPRRRDVLALHDLDAVEIECDVPTPLQVDGEDLGDVTTIRFEAERDALDVVVG